MVSLIRVVVSFKGVSAGVVFSHIVTGKQQRKTVKQDW